MRAATAAATRVSVDSLRSESPVRGRNLVPNQRRSANRAIQRASRSNHRLPLDLPDAPDCTGHEYDAARCLYAFYASSDREEWLWRGGERRSRDEEYSDIDDSSSDDEGGASGSGAHSASSMGRYVFAPDTAVRVEERIMGNNIRSFGVSDEENCACVQRFQAALSPTAPLLACGACGQRRFEHTASEMYTTRRLADLPPLQYTHAETHAFILREEAWKQMKSVYYAGGQRYHVHPELVTPSAANEPSTPICKDCDGYLQKCRRPPLSIAGGVDYGVWKRCGLRQPSPIESLLLAKHHLYIVVLKMAATAAAQAGGAVQSAMRGHTIAFPHDAPHQAAALQWRQKVLDSLYVTLVCNRGQEDMLRASMLSMPHMKAEADFVFNALDKLVGSSPFMAGQCTASSASGTAGTAS